jgi:hypothetical protein
MVKEFIVYIHGITCLGQHKVHNSEYDELQRGVASEFNSNSEWNNAQLCFTEWGWNFDKQFNPGNQRVLSKAQSNLSKRVLHKVKTSKDFTINPLRFALNPMRKLMLFGFSDMFYYVSSDGKLQIRTSICEQISSKIGNLLDDDNSLISLTLIGHSAGSVIAIDISYYLFSGKIYSFVNNQTSPGTVKIFEQLREKALDKKLRLRRLITLGSPISMLACRKDEVVELLAAGRKIDPVLHGIVDNPNFPTLTGPRWINIWEKDDPIALPIEPLMENSKNSVEDILIHSTDSIRKAHNLYWSSSEVHKIISEKW